MEYQLCECISPGDCAIDCDGDFCSSGVVGNLVCANCIQQSNCDATPSATRLQLQPIPRLRPSLPDHVDHRLKSALTVGARDQICWIRWVLRATRAAWAYALRQVRPAGAAGDRRHGRDLAGAHLGMAGFEKLVVIKRLLDQLARDREYVEMFSTRRASTRGSPTPTW